MRKLSVHLLARTKECKNATKHGRQREDNLEVSAAKKNVDLRGVDWDVVPVISDRLARITRRKFRTWSVQWLTAAALLGTKISLTCFCSAMHAKDFNTTAHHHIGLKPFLLKT